MRTVKVLIPHGVYLVPGIQEVEDGQPAPDQRHRWENPPYWLVEGPKGSHWCQAPGRTAAAKVYQDMPWGGELKFPPSVKIPARRNLADGAVFWVKHPGEPSEPYRILQSETIPAPDGYDHITPHDTTNEP